MNLNLKSCNPLIAEYSTTLVGKSAIVAAIQLCLGSTARETGRGSSLASVIREGSDGPAVVRVTLLNRGADAYKPEEYGDKITIERRIHKGSSANTYKLLSGMGGKGDKVRLYLLLLLLLFDIEGSLNQMLLIRWCQVSVES